MSADPQPAKTAANISMPLSEFGSWGCITGISGTVALEPDIRVTGLLVIGGTVTINANDPIDVTALGGRLAINPKGNLVGPTIILASTSYYLIEIVRFGEVP